MSATISLVERKKFDDRQAHAVAGDVWWVGYKDASESCSHNPYLIIDGHEAMLINPGTRSDRHHQIILNKISALIAPSAIEHIVLLDHDPERCASLPLFEKMADRNVRVYAPAAVACSIKHYGCHHPVIALDAGDSIIMKSGRTITFYDTPKMTFAGSGMLHDQKSGTLFTGNIFNCPTDEWDLYAAATGWDDIKLYSRGCHGSGKAFHQTLNKIERLSPQRLCPHRGPIIEENIDKFIKSARDITFDEPGEADPQG